MNGAKVLAAGGITSAGLSAIGGWIGIEQPHVGHALIMFASLIMLVANLIVLAGDKPR